MGGCAWAISIPPRLKPSSGASCASAAKSARAIWASPCPSLWAGARGRGIPRGVSDLYAIGDYLDGYDKMLFGMIDRVGFSTAFIWDVLLKGAPEETVQEWLKEQRPPRPG